jgi:hypothetical protein
MVVNFKVYVINRGTHKLSRTHTLKKNLRTLINLMIIIVILWFIRR